MFQNIQAYIPYYKRNLRLAFPVMLTQLGGALVGLIDSVMVGHYSTADLAAVSFGNGIFFTFMVFGLGAVMAVTPLVGQSFVKKEKHRVVCLLQNGWWFTLVMTLITCALLLVCVPLIPRMGQDEEVAMIAQPYLLYRIGGLLPFMFFCLHKQFLEGLGSTLPAMFITLGANGVNVLLNWLFIYGKCGLEPMGAKGAGLASMLASVMYFVGIIAVMLSKREWREYLLMFSRKNNSRAVIRELFRIGAPIGVQTTMETVLFTLSFIMVGWISKEALAAHQVANHIADLTFMLATGIGAATTIRVSHQFGLRDWNAMKMASNASIHLVLLMNMTGAALMISLRSYIPYLFTEDTEVIEIASSLLIFAGLFQFSDGLQCVGAGMLRGVTDVKAPMWFTVIAYVLIALPLGYILMFYTDLGVKGMWVSFIVALAIVAVAFHVRFRLILRNYRMSSQPS
ncbi:MAG: MATE family efflux transporter [Paludibacteraceae bacterium]|nr:MATE family efflux transporter [Paludibacteraceae bacterium]